MYLIWRALRVGAVLGRQAQDRNSRRLFLILIGGNFAKIDGRNYRGLPLLLCGGNIDIWLLYGVVLLLGGVNHIFYIQ